MKLILSLLFTTITIFSTFGMAKDNCVVTEEMSTALSFLVSDQSQFSRSSDYTTSLRANVSTEWSIASCDSQNDAQASHADHACHSCHLGHCAALITKMIFNIKVIEEGQFSTDVAYFISHSHTRLFRPPIA